MNYTITHNAQFKSIEIAFDGKPDQATRDALKELRFRWHGQKKVWYGYSTEEAARAAIEGNAAPDQTKAKKAEKAAAKANKYGVKIGDIFRSSWGYEQTNNDFFQVVALCGDSSVRVREVDLPMIRSDATGPMSENRTFKISRELLPASSHSVFIKDQEKGDIKRLKSYHADGVSNPQFNLSSYANAYYCGSDQITVYESWYA